MNNPSTLNLQQLSTLSIVQPYNTALMLHNASVNTPKIIQRIYRSSLESLYVLQAPDAAWFAHYE